MAKLKKSQLALGSYHYACDTLDDFLESAKRLGITNVEIHGNRNHFWVNGETEESASALGEKVKAMGMDIVCFCPEQNTFPYNISSAKTAYRLKAVEYLQRAIRMSAAMGCPRMLLCPGSAYLKEKPEEGWKRCAESIRQLLPVATECQVMLMLETQGLEESTHMNSVEQQIRMLQEIDDPWLGAMIDTVQMAMFDESIEKDVEVLGSRLCHVHLGNTKLVPQEFSNKDLKEKLTPGKQSYGHIGITDGELPIADYLSKLADAGYEGYVTVEICSADYFLEAERHAREAIECLKDRFEN